MHNDIKAWLYDILNAIIEIESFFEDRPKEFIYYQQDIRTKRRWKEISRSLARHLAEY